MFVEIQKEIDAIKGVETFIKREIQTHKKLLAAFKIVAVLVATSFPGGFALAATSEASDSLSNSAPLALSAHTIKFKIINSLAAGENLLINTPSQLDVQSLSCSPAATTNVINADSRECVFDSAVATGSVIQINVSAINPSSIGSYGIILTTSKNERANVMFAIVDRVRVSATVPSSLQFVISPVATNTPVNGFNTTLASATSSLAFGSLTISTSSLMAQQLSVTTNATFGYVVTVEQDQNLTSNTGADINSFRDGTSTFETWSPPAGDLNSTSTYGHFGFTADDDSLSLGGSPFAGNVYTGFTGTTAVEIMYHSGPADGNTQNKGYAKVAYRIEVSPFQEAGDYYNTLTYVATPTY